MAKKRSNNEGSIFKRNHGTWCAIVTVQGRRLTYTAKTKREGQDWIRQMLDEIDNGLTYDSTRVSVEKFMEDWLVSVEPSICYNTFKQYSQVTRQYILPTLGKFQLRDLKPERIQQLYNQMVKKGYGLRTVQLVHSVIHRALVHAVKLGLISRNPDDATTSPKPKHKKMQFFDENQVQQLLITAQARNDRFHDLRHTGASLMLNNGIPVMIVSRRLGHARPSITLDVYGHLIPTKQKEVASLMDQLLTPIQIQISK